MIIWLRVGGSVVGKCNIIVPDNSTYNRLPTSLLQFKYLISKLEGQPKRYVIVKILIYNFIIRV